MMRCLTQRVLMGVVILAVASLAAAQQEPQPVVRLGNWLEVGHDLWMHLLATTDLRYSIVENRDFERRARDGASRRNPASTATQVSESDGNWILLRFGVDFRYRKSLQMHLQFEQRTFIDGNLMDDRANCTNPGGTNVFGMAASTENPGFRIQQFYIDYQFASTPLRLRAGADLWNLDPAGTVGRHDPRVAVIGEFGDVDVLAAVVFRSQGVRLGYENNNDFLYYTFSAGYTLAPQRFQLDVVYFRDRFTGAPMQTVGAATSGDKLGWTGQTTDSVLLMGSWTGQVGPVRGLVQGNLVLGTHRGGTMGIPIVGGVPLFVAGRQYDIFAGGVIAYGEVDLGIARPFVGVVWGSADGDPTDHQLHGFETNPNLVSAQVTGVPWFAHLDSSSAFANRDYTCPARSQGLVNRFTTSRNIGTAVLGNFGGRAPECIHSVQQVFNDRMGVGSHQAVTTTYSNVGTLVLPVGVKVFPLRGHELTGWYVYRAMTDTTLVEIAFAPELAAQGKSRIGKGIYHEVGGYWLWTLNPYFDIRLTGTIGLAAEGFKDLARLADCNLQVAGVQPCHGNDAALKGEARIRARF